MFRNNVIDIGYINIIVLFLNIILVQIIALGFKRNSKAFY